MEHKYLIGLYDDEETLLHATEKIRKQGFQMKEILTPFPVHGLDHAMGLQDTRLHTLGFLIGACCGAFALIFMSLISTMDWPIVVGGKPYLSFPAYIPITFEFTVLTAAVSMTIAYYIRNGFSVFKDPEIIDPRITDDRFAMVFCLKQYDGIGERTAIEGLLKTTGSVEIYERALKTELEDNLLVTEHEGNYHGAHH